MARSVRRKLGAGLAAGALIAGVTCAATTANASTAPGSDPLVDIQGALTSLGLPGATGLGSTSSDTPETVSFVLKERNSDQLKSQVTHGMSHFLSTRQFADTYGQTPAVISALESYLAKYGIKAKAYGDDVDVVATGTAGQFDQALSTSQKQYRVPELHGTSGAASIPAQTVHAATGAPKLPADIAQNVLSVLGLTNYSTFSSQTAHVNTALTQYNKSKAAKPGALSPTDCQALTGLQDACNLPSDFASRYGLSPLYKAGADGSGQTTAIVTLASMDPTAPQTFWSTIANTPQTGRQVTTTNVDGGPGLPTDSSGSGETDLDVEQAGGLAPGANVDVYQAPNTDSGFADAYFQAASDNTADSVSASWAESETYLKYTIADHTESPNYEAAFDEAFLELAAQGQSAFTAAGDWGAYTATADQQTTNLSVAASADSPYITAAGGTTNPWSGQLSNTTGTTTANVSVPNVRTWGWDYLWKPTATVQNESYAAAAESEVIGGGGGYSSIESRPSYQDQVPDIGHYNAVNWLTPTGDKTQSGTDLVEPTSFDVSENPAVSSGNSDGRAVPDVSADADPYSGYLLYEPSAVEAGSSPLIGGYGGTSFVAPQLNGSAAVIDSYLGHRVGFWNPSIYSFATSGNDPFTPVNAEGTASSNLYYTGNPGSVYNPGSGLGVPNLDALAQDWNRP
ncbi:MAG: S53 family peptidase [Streptosporangiales bacterium]|nr:S53 family peptidase [Streptosporangiales bacterium]